VRELSHQVETTRQMVRESVERARREIARVQPMFVIGYVSGRDNRPVVGIRCITNEAKDLRLGRVLGDVSPDPFRAPVMPPGNSFEIRFRHSGAGSFELCYTDIHGESHSTWVTYDGNETALVLPFDEEPS
jgi:hypothetical protein